MRRRPKPEESERVDVHEETRKKLDALALDHVADGDDRRGPRRHGVPHGRELEHIAIDPRAEREVRVPNRRTIPAMVSALAARLGPYSSSPHLQVAEDLLLALRGDEAATSLYLQLGTRVWGYPKLVAVLSDLSVRDLLHFDAMEAALAAVRASPHPDLLEASLTSHSDPRVRRLGLAALVHAAGPKEGWTKDRRSRLSRYQRDPSIAVSGPASFVLPPE